MARLFDKVVMVFQNPEAQLFCGTLEREIVYGLESLGLTRATIRAPIDAVAERLAIAHLLPQAPHQLSGGEKHLVAIAAILALRPHILVLDEPYANLDARHVHRLRSALQGIHAEGTGASSASTAWRRRRRMSSGWWSCTKAAKRRTAPCPHEDAVGTGS